VSDNELSRLGNLGQAYGAVSAFLSVVALCAVAGSLFYQARQDRILRADVLRQGQRQLLALAIAEPDVFVPCIRDAEIFGTAQEARRYYFTTLWLAYCRQGYENGELDRESLRAEFAADMFTSPVARLLWKKRKNIFRQEQGDLPLGDFLEIFDTEYLRVERQNGSPGTSDNLAAE
jgi:hypothetical protein